MEGDLFVDREVDVIALKVIMLLDEIETARFVLTIRVLLPESWFCPLCLQETANHTVFLDRPVFLLLTLQTGSACEYA